MIINRTSVLLRAFTWVLAAASVTTLPACAQKDGEARYFEGLLEHKGRAWDVGVQFDFERDLPEAKLYVSSLWRAGVQPDTLEIQDEQVSFSLPFDIGTFEGKLRGESLVGFVRMTDGSEVGLTLKRTARKQVRTEEITFTRDDVTIAATLALPQETGAFPAVVVLHGGGDSSRKSPPYRFWADYLPRRGIACLIYDKRGNGASTGDWREVGFQERAGDVVAALEWLRKHASIDAENLGLLAVSQGSWVADLVAASYPHLGFAVHVSGPVVPVVEADTDALIHELQRNDWAREAIEERVHLWRLSTEVTRHPSSEEHWTRLQEAIDQVRDQAWFARTPYEPSRDSWFRTWYRQVLDFDPLPLLRKTAVPMLWMYGERDSESDLAKNVSILTQLRREQGKPYAIAVFPKTGHGMLAPVDEKGTDLHPLSTPPGFFDELMRWLSYQTCCGRR